MEHNTAPLYLHRGNTTQPLYICTGGTKDSPFISA